MSRKSHQDFSVLLHLARRGVSWGLSGERHGSLLPGNDIAPNCLNGEGCGERRGEIWGTAQDFDRLMNLADSHLVSGLMIDGLQEAAAAAGCAAATQCNNAAATGHKTAAATGHDVVRTTIKPPLEVIKTLAFQQMEIEDACEKLEDTQEKLLTVFEKAGLHPVVMKGTVVGALYPVPHHRVCGDIDLYFTEEEFAQATQVVESLGIGVCSSADGSLHYCFEDEYIEHHPRFFDSRCQFEGLDKSSPEALVILLSTHILKHLLGRGCQLKQVLDYEIACRHLQYDRNLVRAQMRDAGLGRWQALLDEFCGIGIEDGPEAGSDSGVDGNSSVDGEGSGSALFRRLAGYKNDGCHKNDIRHKIKIFFSFISTLPFAVRYAPKEWFYYLSLLVRGNL